ncbi:MAG TPA: Flp family type IVb pilin, partial [Sphingomonadales bacterium]|nr:Flp family type IVb pilin [Sphingomonadales bacterium]
MVLCCNSLARDEHGATAIEYALVAALISIAAVVAMTLLGDSLNNFFFGPISQSLIDAAS